MNPSVLLSAIAASAAALVAIVGGLLVSRVISLATERAGLAQRRDDLNTDLQLAETRFAEVDTRLLDDQVAGCLREARDDLLRERPVDVPRLLAKFAPFRTMDDIGHHIHREALRFAAIREALQQAFADDWADMTREKFTTSAGIPVDQDAEEEWDAMWEVLLEENQALLNGSSVLSMKAFPMINPTFAASELQITAMRSFADQSANDSLVRDVDTARAKVLELRSQLGQAELALARVARPTGVTGGLLVLAYVVASGVLFPLVLLALDITHISIPQAMGILTMFATGLVWLMVYLWVEIRRLTANK